MAPIGIKNLAAPSSESIGDFESVKLHWKKGTNPFGRGQSKKSWLLVPIPDSDIEHEQLELAGDHLAAQAIANFISGNSTDRLRAWLNARHEPFLLKDAAAECLKISAPMLTRDIQTRIGLILRDLGCIRFERRTKSARYWYSPPQAAVKKMKINAEPVPTSCEVGNRLATGNSHG
jgi:hypothetical protein